MPATLQQPQKESPKAESSEKIDADLAAVKARFVERAGFKLKVIRIAEAAPTSFFRVNYAPKDDRGRFASFWVKVTGGKVSAEAEKGNDEPHD
jgi:hypothetical protein